MPRLDDESIRRQKSSHFQAAPRPCTCLEIKVLRASNVSLGWLHDKLDTPDPYVTLRIPHSAEVFAKTTAIKDNKNPVWNETFIFHIDKQAAEKKNILEIALWDFDTFNPDDKVGDSVFIELNDLPDDDTVVKTFTFGKLQSKVYIQFFAQYEKETYHLRYGEDLCDEEEAFLKKRRPLVFEAMKKLLGERAPQNIDEVPNIAVLGSGGGYRAATGFTAACRALDEMHLMDCVMYMTGLSGSAWCLSLLYVHSKGGKLSPTTTQAELREHLKTRLMALFLPHKIKQYIEVVKTKLRDGLPVSFTDVYGQIVGTHLMGDDKDKHKLSEQQENLKEGQNPLPIYTALNSKKDVSAEMVSEWVEFTPYEIGMEKYGTFMKTELFGSQFFCGKLVKQHPEPPICYLQGIWGSFFAILIQRVLEEKEHLGDLKDDVMERIARFRRSVSDDVRLLLRHNRASLSSSDIDEDQANANGKTDAVQEPVIGVEDPALESSDPDPKEDDVFEPNDVTSESTNGTNGVDPGHADKNGTKLRPKMGEKKASGIRVLKVVKEKVASSHHKTEQKNGDDSGHANKDRSLERPKTAEQKARGIKALEYAMDKVPSLRTRKGRAGLVHNFLRGVDLKPAHGSPVKDATDSGEDTIHKFHIENAKKKKIELIDAGLQFNSPYPPVLRPERDVDLILSFDFSARDEDSVRPFKNLKLAEKWAKKHCVPFPPIDADEQFEKQGWKECYMFKDPTDDTCPIVLHFVLINNMFQKFKKPSVPRTTIPEVTAGSFKVFDDPSKCYSTFNLHYTHGIFDNLSRLVEFNTEVSQNVIMDAMAECVERRRRGAQA